MLASLLILLWVAGRGACRCEMVGDRIVTQTTALSYTASAVIPLLCLDPCWASTSFQSPSVLLTVRLGCYGHGNKKQTAGSLPSPCLACSIMSQAKITVTWNGAARWRQVELKSLGRLRQEDLSSSWLARATECNPASKAKETKQQTPNKTINA